MAKLYQMIISLKYPLLCLNSNRFLYNGLPGKIASFQPPVAVSFLASHFCCGLRAPWDPWRCCRRCDVVKPRRKSGIFNTRNSGLLMEFPDAHLVLWVEILATLKFFQKFNDSDFNMTVVVIEVEIKLCIPRDSKSPA